VTTVAPPPAVGAVTLVAKNGRFYGKPDFFPVVHLQHDQCKLYKNTHHRESHSSDAHELPDHSPHVGSLDAHLLPALNSRFVWENAKKRNFGPVIALQEYQFPLCESDPKCRECPLTWGRPIGTMVSGATPPTAVGAVTLVSKNGRLYGKPDFFPAVDLRHDQCELYKNTHHRESHSSNAHELPDHSPHVGSLDGPLLPALNSRFVWENAKKRNFGKVIDLQDCEFPL
jgi:hypothetical protein